jgi:RsbT co-antagonist protein rsbRD N-terminal domain
MTETPVPSPEQQIIGCALANFLADRRPQIVSRWMSQVLRDQKVPAADGLTLAQLEDHIPQILDDLNHTLNDAFNLEIKERAAWRAASHGHIRWQQDYDIAQLIREIGDLRMVLIYHLAQYHEERVPNFNGEAGLFAMIVVHSFFDRLIRISVEQFIAAEQIIQKSK